MAKAKVAKVVDPNRVPVKRDRPEIYRLVLELEQVKARRAKLAKRRAALAGLDEEIGAIDAQIVEISERVAMLMKEGAA